MDVDEVSSSVRRCDCTWPWCAECSAFLARSYQPARLPWWLDGVDAEHEQ
jgi:hypothetical protein